MKATHTSLPKAVGTSNLTSNLSSSTTSNGILVSKNTININTNTNTKTSTTLKSTLKSPINNVITKEEFLNNNKNINTITFNDIILLFTDKHTSNLYTRQISSLNKLCKYKNNGLNISEIKSSLIIFEFIKDRINEGIIDFYNPLDKFIKLFYLPFIFDNSYEMIENIDIFISLFINISKLYQFCNDTISMSISEMIKIFASTRFSTADVASNTPFALTVLIEANIPSALIEAITLELNKIYDGTSSDNSNLLLYCYLILIKDLSNSSTCSFEMIEKGVSPLFGKLVQYPSLLETTVEIIDNLLENVPESSQYLCNIEFLTGIHGILLSLFKTGFTKKEKELRNEILVLLLLFSREPKNRILFIRANVIEYYLLISTCVELERVDGGLVRELTVSSTQEDLEMKLLMWETIRELAGEFRCLSRISQFQLMDALLIHFDLKDVYKQSQWSEPQKNLIRTGALALLTTLAVSLPKHFNDLNGHMKLSTFASELHDYSGYGLQLTADLMKVLFVACEDKEFIPSDFEFFNICFGIFLQEKQLVHTRCYALQILSSICDTHPEIKRSMRKADLIAKIVPAFNTTSNASLDPYFIICLINFIWSSIPGEIKNEAEFRLQDGLEALFQILMTGHMLSKKPALGLLSDLLFNKNNLKVGIEWRNPKGESLMQVLITLWNQQATLRGESTMIDIKSPLGASSSKKMLEAFKMGLNTPHISENTQKLNSQTNSFQFDTIKKTIGADFRPSIYAVCKRFDFDQVLFPELTQSQKTTLVLISKFSDIQLGDVWKNIAEELNNEEIRPITPDRNEIETNLAILEHNVKFVQDEKAIDYHVRESDESFVASFFETLNSKDMHKKTKDTTVLKRKIMTKDQRDDMLKTALQKDLTMKAIMGSDISMSNKSTNENTPVVQTEGVDEDSKYLNSVLNDQSLKSMNLALKNIKALKLT